MTFLILSIALICCDKTELADFGLSEENIQFTYNGAKLKGVIAKPENSDRYPVVVFVHGDGAIDRYQNGYYKYIWKRLTDNGIACMSWDKQGVKESTGNWLHQSMNNRAEEVTAAIDLIKTRNDIDSERIILWGVSQGCWVVPKVYRMDTSIASIIFQSAAINWLRQGKFHLKCRLKNKNYSKGQLARIEAYNAKGIMFLERNSYSEYLDFHNKQPAFIKKEFPLMKKDRWAFVEKNYKSDIVNDLEKLNCPVLGLFGNKDENVDTKESVRIFNETFSQINNSNYEYQFYNDADHALFNIHKKGKLNTKHDVWYKLLYKGQDVFTPGFLEDVTSFILKQ